MMTVGIIILIILLIAFAVYKYMMHVVEKCINEICDAFVAHIAQQIAKGNAK
jgi:uncharacterized membrane protein YukC